MENIKEFKELIVKYDSINLNLIKDTRDALKKRHECKIIVEIDGKDVLKVITGYGSCTTCSLCLATNKGLTTYTDCNKCVYSLEYPDEDCVDSAPCTDHETYEAIMYSLTPQELLEAIKDRKEYMNSLLIKHKIK
jgi:hypothetical protein